MREREGRERARNLGSDRAERHPQHPKAYPHHGNFIQARQQNTVSYFFTNFPDDYNVSDLWKRFSEVGKVGEVFIPTKLDKFGKRFGFVRFSTQNSLPVLDERLKDFWIGSYKVFINKPRFNRDQKMQGLGQAVGEHGTDYGKEGFFSIKSIPMGGNWVLLKGEDSNEIPDLLVKEKAWIEAWFSEIDRWSPQFKIKERLTWVLCFGVPIHMWTEKSLSQMFNSVGNFITLDTATQNRKRLDVARGLISTNSLEKIDKVVKMKVGREVYTVSLMEDKVGGTSPCGEEVTASESVDSDSDDEDHSFMDSDGDWDAQIGGTGSDEEEEVDRENVSDSLVQGTSAAPYVSDVRKLEVIQRTNRLTRGEKRFADLDIEQPEDVACSSTQANQGFEIVTQNREEKEGTTPQTSLPRVETSPDQVQDERRRSATSKNTLEGSLKICSPVALDSGPSDHSGPLLCEASKGIHNSFNDGPDGLAMTKVEEKIQVGPRRKFTTGQKRGGVVILEKKRGLCCGTLTQKQKGKNKGKKCVDLIHGGQEGEKNTNSVPRGNITNDAKMKRPLISTPSGVEEIGQGSKLPRLQPMPRLRKKIVESISKRMTRRKKALAKGGELMCRPELGESHDDSISNSIADSHIKSCCRLHYRTEESVPQRLWSTAKQLGVNYVGQDQDMVKLIEEMEDRDRYVSTNREGHEFGNGAITSSQ
ncbi:hypothetical protein RIF29_06084 [Crotalaria pallida]|uniref:RRM domain-containing protein n=1 Tax=Crotalaria pallida TaxID=3830 RepID=A0AAN9J2T6_CROPI